MAKYALPRLVRPFIAAKRLRNGLSYSTRRLPKCKVTSSHAVDDLKAVAAALNGRPRKTLCWGAPAEALNALLENVETEVLPLPWTGSGAF